MAGEVSLDTLLSKLDDANQGIVYRTYRYLHARLTVVDLNTKCRAAQELRDTLDSWCQAGSTHYSLFLEKSIPVFLKSLEGQPVFDTQMPEQVRNLLYTIY
jgi:transformation/transcription domain-associated protein